MRILTIALSLFLLVSASVLATDEGWPRELETTEGLITIYQPQVESFADDRLEGRTALSVKPLGAEAVPVFGAVWLSARVDVDRDERMVYMREFEVPQVRFPDASEEQRQELSAFLEREMPKWDLSMSLDRLIAIGEVTEGELSTPGLQHTPPRILHSTVPAVLVMLDGEPIYEPAKDDDMLQRIVNTPYLIVHDVRSATHFLAGGAELWYEAQDPLGEWRVATNVPTQVRALLEAETREDLGDTSGAPPKIIVATEPTELIVTDGEPNWTPVEEGVELLYVDNTDAVVFLDIRSQAYFVVLSGRWYRGGKIDDLWTWEHVPNDELPRSFSDIPEDSTMADVLAHVAGTTAAQEAVLDNSIPETTAIRRDAESIQIEYDGDPQFEAVEDVPDVSYAINTPTSVFKVGDRYYACEQAVWYGSSSPTGPWSVATEIPAVLYSIPTSNPHHNVTYVKIYDVTPTVVYVGYTPGYYGSYYYGGCVVYGTGWYYHPWYHHHYYPRAWTWGLNVRYSPWHGWGVGLSFSNGPFTFTFGRSSFHRHHRGWFGPVFRPRPRPAVRPGFRRPPHRPPASRPPAAGTRPWSSTRPAARPGGGSVYENPSNRARNADTPRTGDRQRPSTAEGRPNNVYTDRDGNVYRRNDSGNWDQRKGGNWSPAENLDRGSSGNRPNAERPSTGGGTPSTRPAQPNKGGGSYGGGGSATRPQLERDHSARQRGSQRSYGSSGASRGGSRGGGGRRR